MIRSVEARIRKLEADQAPPVAVTPWRRVFGNSQEECEGRRASMIAAGEASQSDNFIFRLLVRP